MNLQQPGELTNQKSQVGNSFDFGYFFLSLRLNLMELSHLMYAACMIAKIQNIEAATCRQLTFFSQTSHGDVFLEAHSIMCSLWFSEGSCDNQKQGVHQVLHPKHLSLSQGWGVAGF